MNWTTGSMMFYGGLAGAALVLIASAVAAAVLRSGRKKIVSKLNDEYGGKLK